MIIYEFDPQKMPDRLKNAIGLAVLSAAQNENVLCDAIAGLADLRVDYGLSITTHMSMPQRFQAIKALARQRTSNQLQIAELDKILAGLDKANTIRNDLCHYCFCFDPSKPDVLYRYVRKARGSLSLQLIEVDLNQIEQDAVSVKTAGLALQSFLTSHSLRARFRRSSPDRQPEA